MHLNSRLSFDLSTERMASLTGRISIIVSVLHFWGRGSNANPAAPPHSQLGVNHKKPLQTFRPYNIAHRGSNGELPEETEAAYLVIDYLYCIYIHYAFFCDYTRRHSQCTHTHPTPSYPYVHLRVDGNIAYPLPLKSTVSLTPESTTPSNRKKNDPTGSRT